MKYMQKELFYLAKHGIPENFPGFTPEQLSIICLTAINRNTFLEYLDHNNMDHELTVDLELCFCPICNYIRPISKITKKLPKSRRSTSSHIKLTHDEIITLAKRYRRTNRRR